MSIAIIPSRFGSKRFKGNPLALIKHKPVIQWVYEQAKEMIDEESSLCKLGLTISKNSV